MPGEVLHEELDDEGRGAMSALKRLFGRLRDGAAQEEKSGEPPPARVASASVAAGPGSREAIVQALVAQIVKQSENALTDDAVDPSAAMCDRGYLDSLNYVAFLVFVEETYGVRILDYQLTSSLRTVSAVADWVLAHSKSES
jgi:acyl carrier protein